MTAAEMTIAIGAMIGIGIPISRKLREEIRIGKLSAQPRNIRRESRPQRTE
jgi:hypothetical protein